MGPNRVPIFVAAEHINVMTNKKLIVFKLDTCILCTLLAPLNYIDKCRGDVFQAVLLINY